jgi:hypothetical protein
MNLSKYLQKNCFQPISRGPIYESIRNRDIEKALNSVSTFLRKRGVFLIPAVEAADIDGTTSFVVYGYNKDGMGCAFTWKRGGTTSLYSICFTKEFDQAYLAHTYDEAFKWDVELKLKGASIVRAIQLVADVMNGRVNMDKAGLNQAVRDAQIWESLDDACENIIMEDTSDAVIKNLERKKNNLYQRIRDWKSDGKDTTGLEKEYEKAKQELADARVSVRQGVMVKPISDPAVTKMEQRFEEEERATPDERFSDMESYILNVILGIDVSALICGAPGVGKTYRIMQMIKKEGKVRGRDYEVIKGKCTPMVLFQMLHDYQKKGQLLIIDDADDIITDDVSINLIKAATDSSDERIVSYGSNVKIFVPEEKLGLYTDFEQDSQGRWVYPKNFVYEGGVIIITNMNAGQIDTAIRSRAMICDLNFTTSEVLDLVAQLSPHIAPELLTPASKERALDYLRKLAESGAPMEISIRSFILVSKLYLSDAPAEAIERRIREQMKLKFARGGRKY